MLGLAEKWQKLAEWPTSRSSTRSPRTSTRHRCVPPQWPCKTQRAVRSLRPRESYASFGFKHWHGGKAAHGGQRSASARHARNPSHGDHAEHGSAQRASRWLSWTHMISTWASITAPPQSSRLVASIPQKYSSHGTTANISQPSWLERDRHRRRPRRAGHLLPRMDHDLHLREQDGKMRSIELRRQHPWIKPWWIAP